MIFSRALVCATLLSSSAYFTQVTSVQAAFELRTNADQTSFDSDVEKQARVVAEAAFRNHPTETLRAAEVIGVIQHDLLLENQFMAYRVAPETRRQAVERLSLRRDQADEQLRVRAGSSDGSDGFSKALDGAAPIVALKNPVVAAGLVVGSTVWRKGLSYWNPAIPEPVADARRAIDRIAWAMRQRRLKTAAGEILRPQLASAGIEPDKPLEKQPAVLAAQADDKAGRNRERLTKVVNVLHVHVTNVNQYNEQKKDETPAATEPAARTVRQIATDGLTEASGDALAVAYAAQLFNRPEEARIAFDVADVTKRAALAINPGELSTFAATGNYFALALAVKGLLFKTKQPESPFPGLFAALEQLSKQIDSLGKSLTNDIARMDARLGALMEKVVQGQESMSNDTTQIREQMNVLEIQIDQFQAEVRNGHLAIADMMIAKDDRSCLRYDGTGKAIPPLTDFIWCRDAYMVRATDFARNVLAKSDTAAQRSLEMSDLRDDFPLSFKYDEIAKNWGYLGLNANSLLPDPDTWMDATSSFLVLLNNNPDQLRNVELKDSEGVTEDQTLDSVIAAGQELLSFFNWAALSKGATSNDGRVQDITRAIDDIAAGYNKLLENLNRNLAASGLRVDLTKDINQDVPAGASLNFEKGAQVHACNAEVGPLITKSQSYFIDNKGYYARPADEGLDRHLTHWARTFVKMDELQPGPNFKTQIARPILWLELNEPESYRVEPCLRSLVIEDLNMDAQPKANVTVAYDVYLHDLKTDNRALVQSLSGTRKDAVFSAPGKFNLFSVTPRDVDDRSPLMLREIWRDVAANWPVMESLPVDPKDSATLKNKTDLAESILARRRGDVESAMHLVDLTKQIENARRHVAAAISAGTDSHTATAERFFRVLIQNSEGLPAPGVIVKRVIAGERTLKDEAARVAETLQQLKFQLAELVQKHYPSPAPGVISARLRDLEDIRALRTSLTRPQVEAPKPLEKKR